MPVRTLTIFATDEIRREVLPVLQSANTFELVKDVTQIDRIPELLFFLRPDLVLVEMTLSRPSENFALPALLYAENQVMLVGLCRDAGNSWLLIGPQDRSMRLMDDQLRGQFACSLLYVMDSSDKECQGEVQNLADEPLTDRNLTDKELAVLEMLKNGKTNVEVADSLQVSESTVRYHITHILKKLDAANRTRAVVEAIKRGMLQI